MNIQHIFDELNSATDFELFRIKTAIEKLLEDPDRTRALAQKMRVGMQTEYFCSDRNKAIACTIIKVGRTRVSIVENESLKSWTMPFHYLNLDHIETVLNTNQTTGLSKAEIALGDTVGFVSTRDNQEYIGEVMKLNPKKAIVRVGTSLWRVPYSMLFSVLTSQACETSQTLLLADRK